MSTTERISVRSSAFGVVIEKMVFNRDTWLTKTVHIPSFEEQCRLVQKIDEFETVKRLHSETTGAFEALLPSILHRVFKGEL